MDEHAFLLTGFAVAVTFGGNGGIIATAIRELPYNKTRGGGGGGASLFEGGAM